MIKELVGVIKCSKEEIILVGRNMVKLTQKDLFFIFICVMDLKTYK